MSWHTDPMFAWDLETTAPDPDEARIVTATAVWINGAQTEERAWLVNPGIEIPDEAAAIHGVTTDMARDNGVDPAGAAVEIWFEICEAWRTGRPVIGFNLSYDFTVLDRELRRHGVGQVDIAGPVIDGHVIDKHLDKYRKGKRTLTATCAHYGVRLDAAHDATEDALAAARLAWRLAKKYPEQLGDLALVNDMQAAWRAEWAAGFEAYLTKQGTPETVDGSWPLRRVEVPA
jgi:DNA polymerase-3 subunit epsilon